MHPSELNVDEELRRSRVGLVYAGGSILASINKEGLRVGGEVRDLESLIRDSEILLSNDGTLQDFKGEYLRLKKFLAETYKV